MKRDNNTKEIKDLISLYRSGKISPAELNKLYSLLSHDDPELDNFLNMEWHHTSGINAPYDTNLQFDILKKRLGLPENQNISEKGINQKTKSIFTKYPVLRYAAILIIGIISGVLAHNLMVRKQYKDTRLNLMVVNVDKGSKSTVNLPDGTKVRLNSDSKITYDADFGKKSRTVSLDGEGFFEVTKNPEKPFYVKTDQIIIKVMGTSFNIRSYQNEDITETTLLTGSIEILSNQNNAGTAIRKSYEVIAKLSPNQQFKISKSGKSKESIIKEDYKNNIKIISSTLSNAVILDKVNPEPDISWKKDILVFNNKSFSDIAKTLERWYNVDINIEYQALNKIRFSGKFDKESIDDVLKALTLIEPFKYEIKKNQITIFK